MGIIAVAGGTGQVGRALVDGLVEHGGHKVYVLSRNSHEPAKNITFLEVDYKDSKATSKVLEYAGIDTLVCAIGVHSPEANATQMSLIRAAQASSRTRRFVISNYDMQQLPEHIEISALAKYTFEAIKELEKTDLQYTRVVNGWFLDYYGMPYWQTHLHPWINVLNMEKKWAAIPGDGTMRASFITTQDLGRFVARLMDLKTWPKVSSFAGDEISFNELVELAQEIRGSKFSVKHDSLEKLHSGRISFADEFPSAGLGGGDEAFFARIHYLAGSGNCHVPQDESLNGMFPGVRITTIREVMEASWKGK